MQTLQTLYIQNPFWVWLAVGAIFVALDIASGAGKLIWGAAAAALIALLNLADIHLGGPTEFAAFAVIAVAGGFLSAMPWRGRTVAATGHDAPARSKPARSKPAHPKAGKREATLRRAEPLPEPPAADERRTARLVGRIGRTTGEFANGVGRVWIDGAEWGAELDGNETLPSDTPVRVMGVTGGVRLQVRDLMS